MFLHTDSILFFDRSRLRSLPICEKANSLTWRSIFPDKSSRSRNCSDLTKSLGNWANRLCERSSRLSRGWITKAVGDSWLMRLFDKSRISRPVPVLKCSPMNDVSLLPRRFNE